MRGLTLVEVVAQTASLGALVGIYAESDFGDIDPMHVLRLDAIRNVSYLRRLGQKRHTPERKASLKGYADALKWPKMCRTLA